MLSKFYFISSALLKLKNVDEVSAFGGYNIGSATRSCELYTVETGQWRRVQNYPYGTRLKLSFCFQFLNMNS